MSSSSDLQPQDFAVYNDGSIYKDSETPQLNILLYTQSNKPTWLSVALVQDCLVDSCYINTTKKTNEYNPLSNTRSSVLYASFVNDASTYSRQFQRHVKLSIDHPNKNFKFVSLLSETSIQDWYKVLHKEATALQTAAGPDTKRLNIFIENPEFVLYLDQHASDNQVLSDLAKLNRLGNLYIIMPSDKAMLNYTEQTSDLATVYSTFLLKLLHKSHLILRIRPLRTGRAEDITGELVVNRGTIGSTEIRERDYLYLLDKEGAAKLFFR